MSQKHHSFSHILLIHYHYPPLKNSGVYRNYFLSQAFAENGMQVHVITSSNVGRLPTDPLPIHRNIQVHTVPVLDYRTLAFWISGTKKKGAQFSENAKQGKTVRWLMRVQRSFPFQLFMAEGGILYIFAAYFKAISILKKQNINVIYTSFMPYADHWVGWLLKKTFPQMRWVADFRDLHAEPIYRNVIWPGFQRRFEKWLLRPADLVTTVSEGISAKMKLLHPHVLTVTKGLTKRPAKEKYPQFTIAYTGSLFLEFRDPTPVFKALQRLFAEGKMDARETRWLYAGKDGAKMQSKAAESGIKQIFVDAGYVSRGEATDIQDRSHVNVLLTSASPGHTGLLTGKLFEYLEANTPVLCLVKGCRDPEIEQLVHIFQCGKVLVDSPAGEQELQEFLLTQYQSWKYQLPSGYHFLSDKLQAENSWQSRANSILHELA